jgi:hypothetical protein
MAYGGAGPGCAQILCKGRKSAKLQLKSEKTEKNSRAVKLYHGPIFNTILYENEFQNPQIFQQTICISLFLEQSTLHPN